MKLFRRYKEREKKSQRNKELMRDLFNKTIDDNKDYKFLYVYNNHIENNNYVYKSYIVAYREEDWSLVVLKTNYKLSKVYKVIKYPKNKLAKGTYKKIKDVYTIYKENKKDFLSFIPVIKNYEDDDILAFIEQEEEIEDFKEFFDEYKRKPHVFRKIKK